MAPQQTIVGKQQTIPEHEDLDIVIMAVLHLNRLTFHLKHFRCFGDAERQPTQHHRFVRLIQACDTQPLSFTHSWLVQLIRSGWRMRLFHLDILTLLTEAQ
jgi:hypothetical protein